jgi:hypothetical protein
VLAGDDEHVRAPGAGRRQAEGAGGMAGRFHVLDFGLYHWHMGSLKNCFFKVPIYLSPGLYHLLRKTGVLFDYPVISDESHPVAFPHF